MGNTAGVRRNFVELEQRRMEAARLLEAGINQSEVARRLGVHRQSVIRWQRALARAGRAGLKKAGRAGRKPKLSAPQLAGLERTLQDGPEGLGYETGVWTLARVGKVIEQQYGVRYNPSQVWRILRQLDWSCQRPSGRALEREEPAIRRWKRVEWPRIKKSLPRRARDRVYR
jgi:transposase